MLDKFRNNIVFRWVDRIPFLRRSGNASLGDLAKALGITLTLIFLTQLPTFLVHPWYIAIWFALVIPISGLILLLHPFLSHRATFRQALGFNKRRR